MLNLSPPLLPGAEPTGDGVDGVTYPGNSPQPARPPGLESSTVNGAIFEKANSNSSGSPSSVQLDALNEDVEDVEIDSSVSPLIRDSQASQLTESELTGDSSQLASETPPPPRWAPDVVSLDDYDVSDSDSSSHSLAKVRRLPRRLPLRREFQFVRRSIESVSSMGIRSRSSLASPAMSVAVSVASGRSSHSTGRPLVTAHFHQWQIELISDDEDEAGDAEAALRRLEGQIDFNRQREKDMKVGRWLKTAARRHHRDSSVSSTHSGSQISEAENIDDEERVTRDLPDNEDVTISVDSVLASSSGATGISPPKNSNVELPSKTTSPPAPLSPVTDRIPVGIASERDRSGSIESTHISVPSRPNSPPFSSAGMARTPSKLGRPGRNPAPSKFGSVLATHRSFILLHRSETMAQQFAIIEAELFVKIKFEELVSHQWGQSLQDVDVKDWVQFVKDRARLKNVSKPLDSTSSAKLSAILALRARFDLLVNFTSSEILLTHVNERVLVVEKFIRIAWVRMPYYHAAHLLTSALQKSYLHNNFSTLVSLMAGLQTRWVNLAMSRHWHKIGIWEQRIFDDLKKFTSRPGEFKYLRNATAALIDARPLRARVQDSASASGALSGASATSKSKSSEIRAIPPACVPFLGI
jgi:Gdp/GTP exchange factor required for growth at low temperatures